MTTETQPIVPATPPAPGVTPPAAAPVAPPAPIALDTQPPAPAPAPAAPPAPEPVVKFDPTGDAALDVALDYLSGLGFKPGDPAVEAAREGDFAALEAKLLALGDKAKDRDRYLALARSAYEKVQAKTEKHNTEVAALVHAAVGGADQWTAIQSWASKQASPEEKAQINAAFAAGGLQAKAAAKYLSDAFTRAGRPGLSKTSAVKEGAGTPDTGTTPLTAKAYAKAVEDLARSAKGREISNMPEYQALRQRRLASKQAGY